MGDLVAAVDRYRDIPAPTRQKLKARMQERRYDEIVDIRRDSIVGRHDYGDAIRDMHFGTGQVCQTVSRKQWKDSTLERGLVYCEDGHCLLVPTVCRNLSRITRGALKPAGAPGASTEEDNTPLMFDPPAAGLPDVENGGAGDGDAGSFTRVAALPTPTSSTVPVGGGSLTPPTGGPGMIVLPPGTTPNGNPGTTPAIPEPQTWVLFGLGLIGLGAWVKRQQRGLPRR